MGFVTFSPTLNFWEVNSTFKLKEPFKSLFEDDKSKGKKDSSQVMWYIVLCYDLDSKNIFANVPLEEKQPVVSKDYMGDASYYKKQVKVLTPLIEEYLKITTTAEERHVRQLEEYLDKRSSILASIDLNMDNFEAIDKLVVGTDKLVASIKKARENLAIAKNNKGAAKGDRELSLSDRGEI